MADTTYRNLNPKYDDTRYKVNNAIIRMMNANPTMGLGYLIGNAIGENYFGRKRAKTAQKKAEEVKAALKKVEKKARNVKTMAAEAKEKDALELAVDAVELEEKIEKKVKTTKKKITQKVEIFLQSPMGGEITPEMILAKVGQVDKVYVRLDQNKIYWVKGDETGAVDIW